ncbi:hypothetical protein IWW50_006593, partial [Coemansia erecta]
MSPAVSVMSGSSFNSPHTITLDELRRASRRAPRNAEKSAESSYSALPQAKSAESSYGALPQGKWSQVTTPSSSTQDRDSGLFGKQAFTFTPTPPRKFEPIQEEHDEPSPSSSKPRYDVHMQRPETLARTQTLATRSPTPTDRSRSPSVTSQTSTRRRRATTTTSAADTGSIRDHTRSRSFGGDNASSEHITLQQLRENTAQELRVPLIPPPPAADALQFRSPFIGQEGVPEYLHERESDRESATHTRIRRARNESLRSAASPSYTVSSAYSPSYAGSDLAYELTFLGVHPTVESPYTHSIMSRNSSSRPTLATHSASRVMSEESAGSLRRRSMSISANEPGVEELRAARRHFTHTRSESAGSSSRVSSIRDEFEQLASAGHVRAQTSTPPPPPVPALPAMTPQSKKVAQIRERIEEWQRSEHAPGTWSDPSSRRNTTESGTGSSATAMGAQQQIGEIESVGASSSAARSQPSQPPAQRSAPQS